MTKEEMAVNLISTATAMESTSGPTPLTASMRAGAEALRAGEWKPIEGAPKDRPILVRGGTFETDLRGPSPYSDDKKVQYDAEADSYLDKWDLVDCCYYSMWVNAPTHYRELPPPPEAE